MRIKLKFALLFAAIVSGLLIISSTVTYWLFSSHRAEDYKKRLYQQTIFHYKSLIDSAAITQASFSDVLLNAPTGLTEINAIYIDSNQKVLFAYPAKGFYKPSAEMLKNAKKNGFSFFKNHQREGVILNGRDKFGHGIYMVISAHDKFGKRKQRSLLVILIIVTTCGIFVSGVFAFLFLEQIARPIRKINDEIQFITESNLEEHITIPKGFSELEFLATSFNNLLNRLYRAFQIQKNFVHHASHELRTPLAIMLAQTEMALRRELSVDELKKILLSLKDDQQQMIELTNSLLLLSQFEKVNFSESWPLVRLDEIIFEGITSIKRILPDLNVNVDFACMPEDENFLTIPGNDALLRSAVRNLLKNAYTYSEDKTIHVLIDVQDGEYKIIFENKGKTVPLEEKEKLFLPFFRAGNSQQKKGFGLGLSIVQRIAMLHRGHIEYQTDDKNRNCFILFFPVK